MSSNFQLPLLMVSNLIQPVNWTRPAATFSFNVYFHFLPDLKAYLYPTSPTPPLEWCVIWSNLLPSKTCGLLLLSMQSVTKKKPVVTVITPNHFACLLFCISDVPLQCTDFDFLVPTLAFTLAYPLDMTFTVPYSWEMPLKKFRTSLKFTQPIID